MPESSPLSAFVLDLVSLQGRIDHHLKRITKIVAFGLTLQLITLAFATDKPGLAQNPEMLRESGFGQRPFHRPLRLSTTRYAPKPRMAVRTSRGLKFVLIDARLTPHRKV